MGNADLRSLQTESRKIYILKQHSCSMESVIAKSPISANLYAQPLNRPNTCEGGQI